MSNANEYLQKKEKEKTLKKIKSRYYEEFTEEKWIKYALKNNFSIDKM